ncbi:MAG: CheR family methyltransferase [Syntrophales bacterium]
MMDSERHNKPLLDEHLSEKDFIRLSGFIHAQYGICLPPAKKTLLEGRLRRRMKRTEIRSFREYCDYLFTKEGMADELIHMVDAITTNKTDFFREPFHFEFLCGTVLSGLFGSGKSSQAMKLQVWSAACSTGEEPYTLAMVLSESVRQYPGLDYAVLATDISTKVLEKAASAVYETDSIEPIPIELRKKYLLKSRDKSQKIFRITPELRQKVTFRRLNLMENDFIVPEPLHVIFCRNVMIYFDLATQERLIRRFHHLLAPGGYLFMGHAESLHNLNVPLRYAAPTIYRKVP